MLMVRGNAVVVAQMGGEYNMPLQGRCNHVARTVPTILPTSIASLTPPRSSRDDRYSIGAQAAGLKREDSPCLHGSSEMKLEFRRRCTNRIRVDHQQDQGRSPTATRVDSGGKSISPSQPLPPIRCSAALMPAVTVISPIPDMIIPQAWSCSYAPLALSYGGEGGLVLV